jgi:acyl-[acyl-carrier-protein]-phospholipid O-acyltransferase / long-chain-fatty-acid--[acyl-carrier-protein] ligase
MSSPESPNQAPPADPPHSGESDRGTDAAGGESADAAPLLQGRLGSASFLGLVWTQFFGAFNDNMFRWLAVPIAQQYLSHQAAIAWGGLALTLPFLVFLPTAGWLADRFSKRTVIIGCKLAEIALMILGTLCILYGNVYLLFALVALMGTQSALFGPAKFGAIPEILPPHLLSKGNGIMGLATIVAVGLGTVAGFSLYDLTTPEFGFSTLGTIWPAAVALIGVGLVGTIASLFIERHPAADPQRTMALNPIAEAIPGFRALAADRALLRTAWGIAFFYFLAMLSQMNIDPYGEMVLGLEKTDVGILMGILIAGVGTGSILAGVWSEGKVELGIVPLGALGICFSSLFVFLAGSLVNPDAEVKAQFAYWGSCIGLFVLGTSAGLYSVPLEAFLQYRSELKTRGMVLAASYFLSFTLVVISTGIFYLLYEMGLTATQVFMLAGLVTVPVAVYIIWLVPDWTVRFILWLWTHSLYRLRVHGREHVPERGGGLIVVNHVSFVDGILMCISSSRFIRFLVYADFTEMPFLRRIGKIMRVIPIRATGGPKELVRSLQTAREAIQNGELVCIFAEGQLTRTGQMQPFQRGMLKIVQGTDAPIIPAYIHGLWGSIFSWRGGKLFWKRPQKWPYPVHIHFGNPIYHSRDAAQVRLEVERLGAEAVEMDAARQPIPARRFIRHCKRHKGRVKVVDSTKVSLSRGKLLAGALALRKALKRHVLSPDEQNVGLLLPPSVGGAVANMAVSLNGRVGINLNYTLSEEVLNYCVDKAGIKHVLTSKRFLEQKPYTLKNAEFVLLEDLREKITGFDKLRAALSAYVVPARCLEWSLGLHKISPDETLTVVFTSGSTGEPKGVVLSHANIGSNIEAVDHLLNLKDEDGIVGVLPFFHSFGYTACLWLAMCYNVRGIYHFNPLDAKVVGRLCKEHRATILMATPTFLKMYLKRCEKEDFESIDMVVTGAEKLPVELARQFEEKFGILPTEGYGTTELSPVVAVNIPDHRSRQVYQQGTKLGTVGRPIPGVTAKVVDPETGEDRGIGPEGLLLIKGPNVMQGYLDEPEKTAEVLQDGWYNTGDFAALDADGFVTITGRQSRFSKIGGEMVPHIRIEQELTKICEPPGAEDGELTLAVTAVPDEKRGERLVVLYTRLCKPASEVVKELAATGLPKLWLPSSGAFFQVDEIPVLGTGKLDLRGLKELAEAAVEKS